MDQFPSFRKDYLSSSNWSHFRLKVAGRKLLQPNSGEKDLIRSLLRNGYKVKTPAQKELYQALRLLYESRPTEMSFTIDEIFRMGNFSCHRTYLNHETNCLVAIGLLDKEKTKIGGLEKAEFFFSEMVSHKGWDWFIMDNKYFKLPLKGLDLL